MKKCGICHEEKPTEKFARKGNGLQWCCKECQAEYRKAHYQANRQKYIDKAKRISSQYKKDFVEWLSGQSCVDCGNDDIRVLEFDHLSDKEFDVSDKIGSVTLSTLMKEISKCEVVCANCHRIRTHDRLNSVRTRYVLEV